MPRNTDFYLTREANINLFVCRLTEKAYMSGHKVYIYTANLAQSKQLDDLLWTFSDISFIPHTSTEDAPIIIHHAAPASAQTDILINLTTKIPEFYNDFQRVIEIIANETAAQAAGRDKYRQYKQQQQQLNLHDLRS